MRRPDELLIKSEPLQPRALDTTEGIFWVYEKYGTYRAAQTAVVDGPLTPALIAAALKRVAARHPALRRELITTESGPVFVPSSREPALAWVRQNVPVEKWHQELERELNGPGFPEGTLPWRVGFFQGATAQGPHGLVFTVHHSVTDGLGAIRFFDDLLAYCAELLEGIPFGEGLAPLPPAPTLDEALGAEPTARELLRHRARNLLRRVRKEKTRLFAFEGMAAQDERRTGVILRDLSPAVFKPLHQACRKNRVTVNGVLTALTLDALGAQYGREGEIPVSIQASLRNQCQPAIGPNHIGCHVSNVVSRYKLDDRRSLWVRAAEVSENVQRSLLARDAQVALRAGRGRLAAFERTVQLIAADRDTQGRMGALSISNRGVVAARKHGPFQLQALYSPVSLHLVGSSLQIAFGTVNDRLCMTLSYPKPLVSDRTARAVLHELTARIAATANTNALAAASAAAKAERELAPTVLTHTTESEAPQVKP